MKPIEAIVFDLGNVLVTVNWTRAAEMFFHHTGKTWDQLTAFADDSDLMKRFARGEINEDELYRVAEQQIGFRGTRRQFFMAVTSLFSSIQPMMGMVMALEGRIPRYLLSNTNPMHIERLLATFPLLRRFEGHVFSYEVGLLKPDPAIFQLTIERFGLVPELTAYIDDLKENCAAAAALGFRAIHHTNPAITRQELTNMGINGI